MEYLIIRSEVRLFGMPGILVLVKVLDVERAKSRARTSEILALDPGLSRRAGLRSIVLVWERGNSQKITYIACNAYY
jgi:hypothetical protein